MQMAQQASEQHPQRAIRRCGDIWRGRYRPTLLPGRGRAMEADMRLLLSEFVSMVRADRTKMPSTADNTQFEEPENSGGFMAEGAFEVVSFLVYKHRFSCIHQAALLETQEEVWQLLLLVWQGKSDLFPSSVKWLVTQLFLLLPLRRQLCLLGDQQTSPTVARVASLLPLLFFPPGFGQEISLLLSGERHCV